jgi:hypothetical protein
MSHLIGEKMTDGVVFAGAPQSCGSRRCMGSERGECMTWKCQCLGWARSRLATCSPLVKQVSDCLAKDLAEKDLVWLSDNKQCLSSEQAAAACIPHKCRKTRLNATGLRGLAGSFLWVALGNGKKCCT